MLKFKNILLSPIVFSALFVAGIGIKPASSVFWYQPKPPQNS
ncbi:cyclic lactone autoinducer peptide [Desulfofarcimen acetoxidans]|nr:cyclic lactone autoinducer peptide [Desulfofarcimen acetoxidans]